MRGHSTFRTQAHCQRPRGGAAFHPPVLSHKALPSSLSQTAFPPPQDQEPCAVHGALSAFKTPCTLMNSHNDPTALRICLGPLAQSQILAHPRPALCTTGTAAPWSRTRPFLSPCTPSRPARSTACRMAAGTSSTVTCPRQPATQLSLATHVPLLVPAVLLRFQLDEVVNAQDGNGRLRRELQRCNRGAKVHTVTKLKPQASNVGHVQRITMHHCSAEPVSRISA